MTLNAQGVIPEIFYRESIVIETPDKILDKRLNHVVTKATMENWGKHERLFYRIHGS